MPDYQAPLLALNRWIDEKAVQGASAVVWHDGHIVASHNTGFASKDTPVSDDTLFALASISKPITAAAVMRAVEEGHIGLDMPVSMIVPEAGWVDDPLDPDALPQLEALRDRITLRHLLSHTSGLPENVGVKRIRMRDQPTLDTIVDAMCSVPLQSAPGEVLRYSNVGLGLAGRTLERASEETVHHRIQKTILDPLELQNIVLTPDNSLSRRIAHVDDAAAAGTPVESYNSAYWRSLGITWGGYFGTATNLACFAASFLPGVPSPLSEDTKLEMTTDQTGGVSGGVDSAGIRWEQGAWGLGWEVANHKATHWTGTLRSPRTFCHWGQSGTLVWADPDRSLVLAVFANRTVHKPWPLRPPRWSALSDDLIEAVDAGRGR